MSVKTDNKTHIIDASKIYGAAEGQGADMLNLDFSPTKDIIGLTDMRNHLAEIVEDVETTGSQKIIIRKGKPSVVVISVLEFEDMQNRILAMELERGYSQAREEEKRGELIELDELAAAFGFKESDFPDIMEKPEGYDQMIPPGATNGRK